MLRGGNSIQLLRVFGIRIGVDVSWFVVLFLFIFVLSGSFKDTLDGGDSEAYLTAVASALLFFGSLVLHELGHALVARRLGIGISGIDLWFFGGIAKMSGDTESPGDEFKVAVAGPVVTALIIGLCVGIGVAATGSWSDVLGRRHAELERQRHPAPRCSSAGWRRSTSSCSCSTSSRRSRSTAAGSPARSPGG